MKPELFIKIILIIGIFIALVYTISSAEVYIDMNIIAEIESSNNPMAISFKGAKYGRGLYQISEIVLQDYNERMGFYHKPYELFNKDLNETIALWNMDKRIPQMLKYYEIEDNVDNRLWAWNAGIGNVVKGIMPSETLGFICKYNLKRGEE